MAQRRDITLYEGNDTVVHFTLTADDQAFTLAQKSLELYFKKYQSDVDEDALYVYDGVPDLVVVDAAQLKVDWVVDGLDLLLPRDTYWYHLDVLDVELNRNTAMFGDVKVVNL